MLVKYNAEIYVTDKIAHSKKGFESTNEANQWAEQVVADISGNCRVRIYGKNIIDKEYCYHDGECILMSI